MTAHLAVSPPRTSESPILGPGSVLLYAALWRQIANSLPRGTVLIVLPNRDGPQRQALAATALLLHASGHSVRTLPIAPPRATSLAQLPLPFLDP